tara:strand:+ start:347 stop:640 length:294 start_codon:yes stop_codon:yes gene_type:complete
MNQESFKQEVIEVLKETEDLLVSKNESYGNSVLDPVRIFSKATLSEQIRVRIDDKLSRMARGNSYGEDVIADLMGYLVLLRIDKKRNNKSASLDKYK